MNLETVVHLTEPMQLTAWWSWVCVAWILPAGPLLFALTFFICAWWYEIRRRKILNPSDDYRSVNGLIQEDKRNLPIIKVILHFNQKILKLGKVAYQYDRHTFNVRPFSIRSDDGKSFEIKTQQDTVLLHAPVEGTHSVRTAQINVGDRVWIYARKSDIVAPGENEKNRIKEEQKSSVLISTESIDSIFRSERNRSLWLAFSAIVFLLIVELAAFSRYWDVRINGKPGIGHLVDKWHTTYDRRERTGYFDKETIYTVEIAIEGLKKKLDVTEDSWHRVNQDTPIHILYTKNSIMLGQPTISGLRFTLISMLIGFGMMLFVLTSLIKKSWLSSKQRWRGVRSQLKKWTE